MLNVKKHKNFTAGGDKEANALLTDVLLEMQEMFAGTALSVYLGGSYGRGEGGVRLDRENGILYNDLDFFVFARKSSAEDEKLLKEIAEKYEEKLKVDVDFSRIMTVCDIRKNQKRLMMQELKRGYCLVCGEDLLEKYLPALPAEELPFSEVCRLLLNRGMGLLLAGEKIANDSPDTDFILRNIYKAVLGAGDSVLISEGRYRWHIAERLKLIEETDLPAEWKNFYREAVVFKSSPNRSTHENMPAFWNSVRDFFCAMILRCAGNGNFQNNLYERCRQSGEVSLKNLAKYCLKSRTLPLGNLKLYTMPATAVLLEDVCNALKNMPENIDRKSKLYRHWLIFN